MLHIMGTIDSALGQQIVDAVRQVVDKDINFINKEGIIIASTDRERIGTFHEAGYEVAMGRQVVVVSGDQDFEGTRKGINYPIIIDNQVIGVIGITGNPKKIMKYGFLASKITEIFIKEEQILGNYESRKKMIQYLMNMCIYGRGTSEEQLKDLLKKLHIKQATKYYCIIIEVLQNSVDFVEIENKLFQHLSQYSIELYTYQYPNHFVMLVPKNHIKELYSLAKNMKSYKECIAYLGIGTETTIDQIKYSYEGALIALKYARQNKQVIVERSRLDIEIVLEDISKETKQKYIEKIVGNLSREERELLKSYYECNMSLKETADKFYIHKNTVQYRLDKIYEKTGLNPRNFKDSTKLYLGLYLEGIE